MLILNNFPATLPPGDYGLDIETLWEKDQQPNPWRYPILIISVSDGNDVWVNTKDFKDMVWLIDSEEHVKIIHNSYFDLPYLMVQLGAKPKTVYDSLHIERVLHMGLDHSNALKNVLAERCGVYSNKEIREEFLKENFTEVTPEQVEYASTDVLYLPLIKRQQVKEIADQNLGATARLEIDLCIPFAEMFVEGVPFDNDRWVEYMGWINRICDELYTDVRTLINSRRQKCDACDAVKDYGFDVCPVCNGRGEHPFMYQDVPNNPDMTKADFARLTRTEWANWSKDDEAKSLYKLFRSQLGYSVEASRIFVMRVLDPFNEIHQYDIWCNFGYAKQVLMLLRWLKADMTMLENTQRSTVDTYIDYHNDDAADYLKKLIEWRTWTKLRSWGYDKYVLETGRIHPKWNQTGTDTGRISCGGGDNDEKNVNMQNVPSPEEERPNMRLLFPARKNYKLAVADYGQQEARALAQISQDKQLLAAANSEDVYTEMAKYVYGKDEITHDERFLAKTAFLAMSYGSGVMRIAAVLGIPLEQAEDVIQMFHKAFPVMMRWGDNQFNVIRRDGYTLTLNGRKRFCPEAQGHMSDAMTGHFRNVARNAPIQGTGADIVKIAMVKIYKEIKEKNLDAFIDRQIHDEIVVEYRDTIDDEDMKEMVVRNMQDAMRSLCPDVYPLVECSVGTTEWSH